MCQTGMDQRVHSQIVQIHVETMVHVRHQIHAHVFQDGEIDMVYEKAHYFHRTGANCTIPVCTPSCQNNGTCQAPNVCNW